MSTANGNPIVELLGQDDNRRNAVVMTLDEPVVISFSQQAAEDPRNPSSSPAPAAGSATASGSATDPAANTAIAFTGTLPAGVYQVSATVFLSGTVTAADGSNMELVADSAQVGVIAYPGVANVPVTYTATVTLTTAGTIGIQAVADASGASAVYDGSVTATPVSPAAAGTSANGFVLPVNVPLLLNTKSVIYCTATSATASRVSVAAFSYAEA